MFAAIFLIITLFTEPLDININQEIN